MRSLCYLPVVAVEEEVVDDFLLVETIIDDGVWSWVEDAIIVSVVDSLALPVVEVEYSIVIVGDIVVLPVVEVVDNMTVED